MLSLSPRDVVWYPIPDWVEDPVYIGYEGARKMSAIWTDNFDDLILELRESLAIHHGHLLVARLFGAGAGRLPGTELSSARIDRWDM